MCEQTNSFKLCSCVLNSKVEFIHPKNSRRNKKLNDNSTRIVWTLYRYAGSEWSGMDGMLIEPAERFDDLFTAGYIQTELNTRRCFDFVYDPSEGDCLELRLEKSVQKTSEYKIMSFIYRNGSWTNDRYNPFYEKIVEINKGKLKQD